MDFFDIPDDYKPQKPLTMEQMDEITNYLKGHPLFLKEMPEDISNNQALQALQAMKEEQQENPLQYAENLNKQANRRLLQGPNSPYYMKDAYEKYTKAINIKCNNADLNGRLHANRAAINLKYKNYGKVIEDCKKALQYSPNYGKAFYRLAKAYIALNRYEEAIILLSNRTQNELIVLRKEAEELKKKDLQSKMKLQKNKSSFSAQVQNYFKQKNWKLGKTIQNLPTGAEIQFIDGKISIPIVVFYPQFGQFDLIAKTNQTQQLNQCVHQLFSQPLPWDEQREYNINTVQFYLQVSEAILFKIQSKMTISQIASRKPVNGAIQIIVIAQNNFKPHFLQQHKLTK